MIFPKSYFDILFYLISPYKGYLFGIIPIIIKTITYLYNYILIDFNCNRSVQFHLLSPLPDIAEDNDTLSGGTEIFY